jgi:glycerol kinase
VFDVLRAALPSVHASSDPEGFGETDPDGTLGAAGPVTGVVGDQQAALSGQVGAGPRRREGGLRHRERRSPVHRL